MSLPKGDKHSSKRKSRYYKTPYNESLKIKDSFTIPETQAFIDQLYKVCEEYSDTHAESQINGYKRVVGSYVLSLEQNFDVKLIDRKYLFDFYNSSTAHNPYGVPVSKDIIHLILIMNKKHCWDNDLHLVATIVLPYIDDIENISKLIIPFLDSEKDFKKCRLIKIKAIASSKEITSLIDFDTTSVFIQELLLEYMKYQYDVFPRIYHLPFFKRFSESLNYCLPDNVYDFNAKTLKKQGIFFEKIHKDSELDVRCFYRFLIDIKQGKIKSIGLKDGVSIIYLMSERFSQNYANGYMFVPLNPNESYPEFDKWAASPNGLETQTSSDKPNAIKYIDFGRISDIRIRNAAKSWFWSEAKAGFENRYRNILYIIEFFEHRDSLRNMYMAKFIQGRANEDLDINNTVLAEEIVMYTSEWYEKLTKQSYTSRISPLKIFLKYMNENNIYKTETASFEYLTTKNQGVVDSQEILPIPKDDFKKLVSVLEEKSKNNVLHMLYYIVFCLNTLTPLRISSILDLRYDCVFEKRNGIYGVNVKVKTSDGDEKEIQISTEVKRLIDVAITLTNETRSQAPNVVKHYLFLVHSKKNIYKSIPHRSYNKHIENCCKKIGIAIYSANNLRKTYYTNLVENAIKNNVSLISLKELTAHNNIDTADNYYVKENIRNYLEATTGVEIGNLPIEGKVVTTYPDANHEDLVNNECGYCRNPECNVLGTANCLMCKGFVTTPEHIHQFEESINIISRQIEENNHHHDKEHLYAIKKLYVAYLEQLYIRKEEMNDV